MRTSEIPELHQSRNWWPMCAKCGRVVEKVESVSLPVNPDKYQRAIRDYVVTCHGETETQMVGIWAVPEMVKQQKRLPDAFK